MKKVESNALIFLSSGLMYVRSEYAFSTSKGLEFFIRYTLFSQSIDMCAVDSAQAYVREQWARPYPPRVPKMRRLKGVLKMRI